MVPISAGEVNAASRKGATAGRGEPGIGEHLEAGAAAEDEPRVAQQQVIQAAVGVPDQTNGCGMGSGMVEVALTAVPVADGCDRGCDEVDQPDRGVDAGRVGEVVGELVDLPGRGVDTAGVDTGWRGDAVEAAHDVDREPQSPREWEKLV